MPNIYLGNQTEIRQGFLSLEITTQQNQKYDLCYYQDKVSLWNKLWPFWKEWESIKLSFYCTFH